MATIAALPKLRSIPSRELALYAIVFIVYFAVARFSLYVYYEFHTTPALIWPTVGLALFIVLVAGYRMLIPMLAAQFLATWLLSHLIVVPLIIALAYGLQTAVCAYILTRNGFRPTFESLRGTMIFVLVALLGTMIEPTIATLWQGLFDLLSVSPLVNFARAWSGGLFSVLVITPFLLSWWVSPGIPRQRQFLFELAAAFGLLIGVDYFLFWTSYTQIFGIAVIFFLPAALMWFVLRFEPKWTTLATFLTSLIGLAGSVLSHPTSVPLSAQLFADEVYIGLVGAIFMLFVAIVEERRTAFKELSNKNHVLDTALSKISAEDKAKSDFIAILAHELRNPLSPIVSAHEWLKLQPQTPSSLEALASAEANTLMMRRLLDDLLDIARVSQNKFRLQKEKVRIQDVIAGSVASTADFLEKRGQKLRLQLPAASIWISVDAVRLKQVLINLLNNAGKYTETGGTIELSCEMIGNDVVMSIQDTGIGIPADYLQAIFEPFKQIQPKTTVGTGLGIGLSITKRLVEMHGGTIEAKSPGEGRGSTFIVKIPLVASERSTPEMSSPVVHSVSSVRILIVDDNEAAARGLDRLLKHLGHAVHVAYTGEEALGSIASFEPDIVLLDIGLPDMSGFDVARGLRNAGWHGRITAITGYGQEADRRKAEDAGIDHYLTKPVAIADVIALLPEPSLAN